MKRGVRILALALAIVMLLGIIVPVFASAKAQWDKDVYAYGAGLNQSQIEETAELLGVTNLSEVKQTSVSADDLNKYLKIQGTDSAMISSIYVMKRAADSGVEILITTPDNITKITGAEYTNAALTAGVTDAIIHVGAYRPVTGESALTGVYKAFELSGEKLDEERVAVANEELETVNAIVTEHENEEKFNVAEFNQIIINIKDNLIQFKQDNNQVATEEQIRKIVDEKIKEYDLQNIITQVNIDNLVIFFQNFQNTAAIDSTQLQEQLKTFGNDLKEKAASFIDGIREGLKDGEIQKGAKDALDNAKDYLNNEDTQGLLNRIGQFFSDLFEAIGDFFKSIF